MEKLKLESHTDLIVWQKAMLLVELIYQLTKSFPSSEQFGIISQMRRAAIAIPANITEGYHRNHLKEYLQFLFIAKSSAFELDTLLEISYRLEFSKKEEFVESQKTLTEILKMLSSLITKLKIKQQPKHYNLNPKP